MSFATTKLVGEALSYNPALPEHRAQALAAVLGALLGDALGVPHEFKSASDLPSIPDIAMTMSAEYRKSYSSIPYGTWSDDGSQLLCLLDVLAANNGSFSIEDFASRLTDWYSSALHQAGGVVFDCGAQTGYAIRRLLNGVPPDAAAMNSYTGAPDRQSNGNGSLMRVLPVALSTALWGISDDEAVRTSIEQSRVTHAHPIALMTCAVFTQLAILVMRDTPRHSWTSIAFEAIAMVANRKDLVPDERAALELVLDFARKELPTGHGYAPNTLWSAIFALDRGNDYLSAVKEAIGLGNDTDSTATVTGGLAALAYGLESIPAAWWENFLMPNESLALLESMPSAATSYSA